MIKRLEATDIPLAVEVIRTSFATVAKDFGLTEQNCPSHTSFSTTAERLNRFYAMGALMYGLYEEERLVGYVALSKSSDCVYEIHNLAVLPEHRHRGYGTQLLKFCLERAKELKGTHVTLSFNEDNTVLERWYTANEFILTDTKRFESLPFPVGYMEYTL